MTRSLGSFYPGEDAVLFVVSIVVQTSVIIVAAWVAARVLARYCAALRHAIWFSALVCVVISPLTTQLGEEAAPLCRRLAVAAWSQAPQPRQPSPHRELDGSSVDRATENENRRPQAMARSMAAQRLTFAHDLPRQARERMRLTSAASQLWRGDLRRVLGGAITLAWFTGVLVGAGRFVHGVCVTRTILRTATQPDAGDLHLPLCEVRKALGVSSLPQFVVSDVVCMPCTVGLLRPRVILPARLLASAPECMRDVLLHECAHVVRRDQWTGLVQRVVSIVAWPHPFIHILCRNLSRAREEICDNVVIGNGDAVRYAEMLFGLSRMKRRVPLYGSAGLFSWTWRLEHRIADLLDARRDTRFRLTPRMKTAVTFAFVSLSLTAAASSGVQQIVPGKASPVSEATRVAFAVAPSAAASPPVVPSSHLVPDTATAYVSLNSVSRFRECAESNPDIDGEVLRWIEREMIRFVPIDERRPIRARLGVSLHDLAECASGEIALARVPSADDRPALLTLLDVSGRDAKVDELLATVRGQLKSREVAVWRAQNILCIAESDTAATSALERLSDKKGGGLCAHPAFRAVSKLPTNANDAAPSLHWYRRPVADTRMCEAEWLARRRGQPWSRYAARAGLDHVQAVGGTIQFPQRRFSKVHWTKVYAPTHADTDRRRFPGILDLPNQDDLSPPDWVPQQVSTYGSLAWNIRETFDSFVYVVDPWFGEGFFEDFVASLREDINGPQLDIRRDLIPHLGERFFTVSGVGAHAHATILAIEARDEGAVLAALERPLREDPYARPADVPGAAAWELLTDDNRQGAKSEVRASSALAVARGYLWMATDVPALRELLGRQPAGARLGHSRLYSSMSRVLDDYFAGSCFRFYARGGTDLAPPFRIIPLPNASPGTSRDVWSRLLQRSTRPANDVASGSRDHGPSALGIRTDADGWTMMGFTLRDRP